MFDAFTVYSLIDLTTLNDDDTPIVIDAICDKATSHLGHVAAVCVYPQFVKQAVQRLQNTLVKVATVSNFPFGNTALPDVILSIQQSIQAGAKEIDVVFPYQEFLNGEKERSFDFIRACKKICGENILLKVILETGNFTSQQLISEAAYELCHAGADFLKTSTGKTKTGATVDAVKTLLSIVKKVSRPIGIKVSGGIRTLEDANIYLQLAKEIMGKQWITPTHFRIGASRLVYECLKI